MNNQIIFYDGGIEIDNSCVIDYMMSTGKSLTTGASAGSNVVLSRSEEDGWMLIVFGHDSDSCHVLKTGRNKLTKNYKEQMMSFIENSLNGTINGENKKFAIYR